MCVCGGGGGVGGEVKADEPTISEAIKCTGVALTVHTKQNKEGLCGLLPKNVAIVILLPGFGLSEYTTYSVGSCTVRVPFFSGQFLFALWYSRSAGLMSQGRSAVTSHRT